MQTTNNYIELANLKNGNYNIEIAVQNKDFSITKQTIKFNIFISSPFYKKIWFLILLTIILTSSIIAYLNFRNNKKRKLKYQQLKELDDQRLQITADLHDDIGASLSSLQLNTTVASRLIDTDINKAKQMMEKVENQSNNLAQKIGDFIWSMKTKEDELMTLSNRIRNYTTEIFEATDIETHFNISNQIDIITNIKFRKNILLIAKEALNNCAKYSQAKNVHINISFVNNELTLMIKDDGIGMAINKNGNGLSNMQKRVEELNGSFEIHTEQEKGVEVLAKWMIVNS